MQSVYIKDDSSDFIGMEWWKYERERERDRGAKEERS